MSHQKQFESLNLELPPAPKPIGNYIPILEVDSFVYLSGHGPLQQDKTLITGIVGKDLDVEEAYAAAKLTGLGIIATLINYLGSLDRIDRLVKTFGLVQCTADFTDQPKVINGCSDLMAEIFKDRGVAARSAVGAVSLPAGMSVEIETVFRLKD